MSTKRVWRNGLELCTEQIKKKPYKIPTEPTFEQLMEQLTPEMLRPYGIALFWPRENVKQVVGKYPVASRYELDLYREIYDKNIKQLRDQRPYAERIARRLESVKAQGHPVISTWDSKTVSIKSVLWFFMFVKGEENDFGKFFDLKVQEAKPLAGSGAQNPTDTNPANNRAEDQPVQQAGQQTTKAAMVRKPWPPLFRCAAAKYIQFLKFSKALFTMALMILICDGVAVCHSSNSTSISRISLSGSTSISR